MMRLQGPAWASSFAIFWRFVHSFLALGMAWLFWQITSPLNWGYGVAAILGALGGGLHLIKTLLLLAQHISRDIALGRMTRKTPPAKGDQLTSNERLDEMGMR